MNLNSIQDLRKKVVFEINALETRIRGQKGVDFLIKTRCSINSLNSIASRLSRIEKLLQTSSYNLVFIGKIGVGKTTAICHLFNLILEEEKAVGKSGKTIRKISELLSTGSGRTTICEVVVKPTSEVRSFLEIEPYDNEEVEEFIREVCTYFWNTEHDQYSETLNLPPAELLRAIRNITDLRDSQVEGNRIDKAIELVQASSSLDAFTQVVLDRASLSERNQKRLDNSNNFKSIEDEKKWLRDNFNGLNLGRLHSFSLPKRIYVHVSDQIMNFSEYPKIKSIIDTRGMDNSRDRKDLSDYIRGQDDSICLFVEQFITAPSNISELLKKYLTPESRDIDTKLATVILPRKGEPEDVVSLDGKVQSREEGIEVRTSQVYDAFARENIKFISQNIFFYDALQFYDDERVLKAHYEKNDVASARKEILDAINEIIFNREIALLKEVEAYKEIFQVIKSGGGLNSQEEKLINDLKKTVESHRKPKFLSNFELRYKNHLKSYHVMVFRAINNRFGTYDLRGIDIYFDSSSVSEKLLRDKLIESKAEIVGAIEFVEEYSSQSSGVKPVMNILKEQVDELFEKTIIEISQGVCEYIRDSFAPQSYFNEFWNYAQNRWGKGRGYRDDVLARYGRQMGEVDDWLAQRVQQLWNQNFMDKILEFFGEGESD
jgi:predicted peroxiredoxin/GTPase SAR1 family protein